MTRSGRRCSDRNLASRAPGLRQPEPAGRVQLRGRVATFEQISDRTARFVALQFEHPYGAVSAW
jgi:hypothetical protein